MYKAHHPKADRDRLYVKRKEGVRGLVQIEAAYKAEITNIAEYLNTNYKADQFVNIVKSYESTQPTVSSIIKTAAKITEELSQPNEKSDAKQEGIQHTKGKTGRGFNPLKPELNPICYLLALLGAHHFLRVSRIRVKSLTFRRLMSYTYGAPILDVSRSHTTTQHSR